MDENYKLAKWLNNEMTTTELAEFEASSDFVIYDKIKKYSNELKAPTFDEDTMLEKIINSKHSNSIIPLYNQWFFRIAAMLTLFIGIGYFLTTNLPEHQLAQKGEKTNFKLPDNSEVVLNSDSEIDYNKHTWYDNRKLNLKGEAYFKVAKGKKFVVLTNLGTVTVLGTQFDVKSRNNRLDVVCYEGRVKVNYQDKEVIITKTGSVSFENGIQLDSLSTTDVKPSWLNNEINFNKNNLNSILEETERQYNIKIKNKSNNKQQLFTGKIPSNNLASALQIIASTYHLQTTKISNENYVLEPVNAY